MNKKEKVQIGLLIGMIVLVVIMVNSLFFPGKDSMDIVTSLEFVDIVNDGSSQSEEQDKVVNMTPAITVDKTGAPPVLAEDSMMRQKIQELRLTEIEAKIEKARADIAKSIGQQKGDVQTSIDQSVAESPDYSPVDTQTTMPAKKDHKINLYYLRMIGDQVSAYINVNGINYEAWPGRVIDRDIEILSVDTRGVTIVNNGKTHLLRPESVITQASKSSQILPEPGLSQDPVLNPFGDLNFIQEDEIQR